jgi:hypothetical protein
MIAGLQNNDFRVPDIDPTFKAGGCGHLFDEGRHFLQVADDGIDLTQLFRGGKIGG